MYEKIDECEISSHWDMYFMLCYLCLWYYKRRMEEVKTKKRKTGEIEERKDERKE